MNSPDALPAAGEKGEENKGGEIEKRGRRGFGATSSHCPGFHAGEMKTLARMNFFPTERNWTAKIAESNRGSVSLFPLRERRPEIMNETSPFRPEYFIEKKNLS